MVTSVNVYEAKTNLSKLLEAVERGEAVTIARAGRPIADLVPHRPRRNLVFGSMKGQIRYESATFDDPDDEITTMFDLDD